jgi:hypothetical protein
MREYLAYFCFWFFLSLRVGLARVFHSHGLKTSNPCNETPQMRGDDLMFELLAFAALRRFSVISSVLSGVAYSLRVFWELLVTTN